MGQISDAEVDEHICAVNYLLPQAAPLLKQNNNSVTKG